MSASAEWPDTPGCKPDLVTYGKVIGGGFPVGAYGGRADLMDLVAPAGPVYQAGTLSANPVAMQAGIAMLKKLKRDNPYPKLERKVESLAQEARERREKGGRSIQGSALRLDVLDDLRQAGSRDGVVRTPDSDSRDSKRALRQRVSRASRTWDLLRAERIRNFVRFDGTRGCALREADLQLSPRRFGSNDR